jgi:hypothetical protein
MEELIYLFKEFVHQWQVPGGPSIPQFVLLFELGKELLQPEVDAVKSQFDSITAQKSSYKLLLVNITAYFDPSNAKNKPTHCVPEQFGLGYRFMCQLYAGDLFLLPELLPFRYIMRLDTDSRIHSPILVDPLADFRQKELVYGWIGDLGEGGNCLVNFQAQLIKFVESKEGKALKFAHSAFGNIFFGQSYRNFKYRVYYNNFEITDAKVFRGADYQNYFKFFKDQDVFIKYRWGDHAVRAAFVTLYVPAEKIKNYCDILDYSHNFVWSKLRCPNRALGPIERIDGLK